jgi:hypothetical protein
MTADETTETGTPAAAVAGAPKVGRNDACPCGSGKKFKKCCINEAAYNVVPETKVATSAKAPAKPAANAGHPAAKQGGMKSASAAAVSKTSTRRKV